MRRAFVMALVTTVVALIAPGSADALNRQYTVLKCHVFAPTSSEVQVEAQGAYRSVDACGSPDQRFELTVDGFGLPGQAASIRIRAPDNTAIVGVIVDANLRRENHHLAQLGVVEPNGTPTVLANGNDSGSGFQNYTFSGLNGTYFVAQLVCSDPSGCPNSTQAHAFVKNIALVLEDRADPGITDVDGTLVESGWIRGPRSLHAQGADLGGGLASVVATVNGSEVGRASAPCEGPLAPTITARLAPCPVRPIATSLALDTVDTARSPFVNGTNDLSVCATDFAGNGPVCQTRSILIDNLPPELSFFEAQDPSDPELIRVRASDPQSGIAGGSPQIVYRPVGTPDWLPLSTQMAAGEISARVDSSAVPAGNYEFAASARDVAGNAAQTTSRSDGSPMILTFPLRAAVQLSTRLGHGSSGTETVAYGHDAKAQGQLLDGLGQPLVGREITVTEYFGSGALIDHRVRTVLTGINGRWRSRLPAGPSRTVTASFAGTPQYRPAPGRTETLEVRSRSSFTISRDRVHEGDSVLFEGKVGHFGARIPHGGKLVELQVRDSNGSWNTVREAFHTDSSGHFRMRYRFGRFYESDAHFVFRVKVAREQGWPYKAPSKSRPRSLTVVANQ